MGYSAELQLVALLDLWIAPKPVVSELVRKQLLSDGEEEIIRTAISARMVGYASLDGLYAAWLSHSGIDFEHKPRSLISTIRRGELQRALFDLMLGQRVKSFKLNKYTEVHTLRSLIQGFVESLSSELCPSSIGRTFWWDGICPLRTSHHPWISKELGQEADFVPLFESWLDDSKTLQNWLETLELETPMVNNPDDYFRVFSHTNAVEIMGWAKVRSKQMLVCDLDLTSPPSVSGKHSRPEEKGGIR